MHRTTERLKSLACSLAAFLLGVSVAQAEAIKIGGVRSSAAGALYIATEKGYFSAAGIEPQFIDFDSPGSVPVAVVSGAIDIGGMLSHGAIVARELGIPCVISTGNGTSTIRSGDRVLVDGDAGTVEILERPKTGMLAS